MNVPRAGTLHVCSPLYPHCLHQCAQIVALRAPWEVDSSSLLNLCLCLQCPEAQQENKCLNSLTHGYLSPGLCLSQVSCSFPSQESSRLPGSLGEDRTFMDLQNHSSSPSPEERAATSLQPGFANSLRAPLQFANPGWQENRHLLKGHRTW